MKYLVFDAGPLISLAMNGLLPLLESLKKEFRGTFIITPDVKREIIDKPSRIKKFKLEAVKLQHLLDTGVLELSTSVIAQNRLSREVTRIGKLMNGSMRSTKTGEKIELLHQGEISCIAFSILCEAETLLVVDERTTRLLFEKPELLVDMMSRKLGMPLSFDHHALASIRRPRFVRSSELVFLAYKHGHVPYGHGKQIIEALLYGLKYHGTTISAKEIDALKSMA